MDRNGRDTRVVTSHVHPSCPCKPCILCEKGNQPKYSIPSPGKMHLFCNICSLNPPSILNQTACICRSCRNDVKDIRNKQLIPSWRKTNKVITQSCFVRMYPKITKLANKFFFSIEENENINPQHSDVESKGVSLCTEHYGAMVQAYQPISPP